jgi:hypothetical protein
MTEHEQQRRQFFRVAGFSTALGFGTMAGVLASLRDVPYFGTFVFTIWSVVAFVVAAAVGWGLWRIVEIKSRKGDPGKEAKGPPPAP